jgi:rSAM/selenodomain-associated transferase 1
MKEKLAGDELSGERFDLKCAIVIMAKAPIPGLVKTRMTPWLDPMVVSSLYHNFLLDKIEQVKNIGVQAFIAYTPETGLAFFRSIIPPGFDLINQVGADLGERLADISKSLFGQGFEKVLILDSDTPNLPVEYIQKGLDQLDKSDVILGPCEDGGYYLIGLRECQPLLFQDIPWSTSRVTEFTVKKAQSRDLSVFLLEKWYDIDTIDDLLHLKLDLDSYSLNQKGFFCKNTYFKIKGINI